MHLKNFIAAIILAIVTAAPVRGEISIVYPAPGSWARYSDYLILKLNSTELSGVSIHVNGVLGDLLEIGSPEYRKMFQDIVIVQPSWDPGRNQLVVEGYKGKNKVETVKAEIYFYGGSDPSRVPPEFKPFVMHSEEREKLCTHCHNMAPALEQMNSNQEKLNPCFGCHKKIISAKYVHGPAGTYSCGYCHTPGGSPKYLPLRREAELCNSCHAEKAAEFRKRKFVHGPIEAGMCEPCHDPHGSPYPAQLRLKINDLCLSCHETIRKDFHVVRTTTGEGHPLGGRPDPSKAGTGRELSCISCHNPHSGDGRFFFQGNAVDRSALCILCHNK